MRLRGFLALLLLAATMLGAVAQPIQQASAYACGPCPTYVTQSLNLRASASSSSNVLAVMPAGSTPGWYPDYGVSATGYARVIYNGTVGYAFADYIILYPATGTTTAALNMRTGAGTGYSVITVMPAGATVTIILGPTSNGWYQVEYGLHSGYALGTYLAFQDNNVSFVPGETPYTTTSLRLRTGAGTGYGTIAILPTGTQVTIISGPIFANTYGWYRVSSAYGTGWVAGDYLQ